MMYTTQFDNESGRTHHKPSPEWTEQDAGASHTAPEETRQQEVESFPAPNMDPIETPGDVQSALAY